MPLTETTTKEGYTDVTYLTTLSLKFLDANEIEGSKIPPVIWSGSISQTSKTKQILLDDCGDYFALMLNQFPEVWYQNSEHYYLKDYSYTGLWFNKNDLQNISEVIPGSPADKIGIQKGDRILSINGYKLPVKYSDAGPKKWNTMAYEGARSGFRYLFIFSKLVFKPYKTDTSTLVFKIERNGKKMTFEIKPESRFVFLLIKK
jgi:membrane-associated protease RseP (regulator of RpoE activity)